MPPSWRSPEPEINPFQRETRNAEPGTLNPKSTRSNQKLRLSSWRIAIFFNANLSEKCEFPRMRGSQR